MNSAPCSRVSHLLVLHLILLLGFGLKLDAAELASARSGPTGGQAKLFFQPTDEPLTRLEGWQLIYGFQMRSVRVAETPIGYPDLVHGQINEAYQVPVSTAPKRRFRKQTITSNWAADFMAPLPHTIEGSMNLTIQKTISVDGTLIDLITGSFQEREVTAYRVVTGYGDFGPVYGDAVFTQTTTTNGTPLRSFGNLAGAPTPVFENGTVLTHYSQTNRPDTIGFWSGKCIPYWSLGYVGFQPRFWGADRVTHVEAGGVDPIFGTAAPTEWTATKVVFRTANASLPIPLVNTGTYDYTLELSEEDTMADTLARYNQSLAVAALETLPWNTERRVVGGGQKQDFAGAPDSFSATFYNESARQTEGYLTSEKAQIRFVVPPALRVPGAGYRMRVIETFQANQSPGIVETVAIYEVDLQAGQWESPVITPVFRDNGTTELRYFTLAAELIQPRRVAALPGATAGPAPWEYLQRGPVFQNQAQVTDTTNQGQAQRRILVDSLSLQQINLADTFLSHYALSGLTATWSVLAGATASVRLWGWHNDGSALGQWTLLAPGADLQGFYNSPFLGEPTDYLFVEAATGGEATVRITITVGGKEAHDDLLVQSRPISIELAVDANRDGTIKLASEDASDATSTAKPYRFWLNDDIDRHNQVDTTAGFGGYDVQDDLNPADHGNDLDWQGNHVPGTRDLEDWARLWINIGGLQDMIASGQIMVGLKWTNVTEGAPAIKLIRAYEVDGGAAYLTSTTVSSAQVTAPYGYAIIDASNSSSTLIAPPASGTRDWDFVIPTAALENFSAGNPTAHFLLEGCQRGKGQLSIVLLKNTGGTLTKIGDGPGLWVDLKNIKEMYERWTVGEGNGGAPTIVPAAIATTRLPSGVTGLTYGPLQTGEQNQYTLYVHGWNMEPWEKDAFAETAFKRLYWLGYRGRFGTFQWPTTYGGIVSSIRGSYDKGEHSAWQSATPLAARLAALSSSYGGNVYVLAHSMGNVVTGEALRLAAQGGSGGLVKTYVASQAAVPGEAWDATLASRAPLTFATGRGPDTPDIYGNWMLANNGSAVATKVNFYNTTDYALGYWQTNQTLKPDWYFGTAYYYASSNLSVVANLFKTAPAVDVASAEINVKGHTGLFSSLLNLGDATNATTTNRYDIMAYDAEPRSLPLGAIAASVNGFSSLNLGSTPITTNNPSSIWQTDTLSGNTYSAHPWHSAQFRFDNMTQSKYWKFLLGPSGFDLLTP